MLSPLLERRISSFKNLQQIHAQLITTGLIHHPPHLTKLLSHSLSNSLSYACTLFKHTHIQHYNTILYNTIIRGLVDHNSPEQAILSYVEMLLQELLPDRFTYPSLLKACAQLLALNVGKALHGQAVRFGLDYDLYIETTLITMYAACGDVNSARKVFDRMGDQKTRNLVVWTSMISGYVKNQSPRAALALVSEMERQGQVPDEVTMVSALSACGDLKDLSCGKKLHLHIERSKMKVCVVLGTAIVDMYAKCGDFKSARQVFDAMHERNVVAWSAMISGYARNNRSGEAIKTFDKMVRESDQKPNEVTIMAVLSACAQSGNSTLGSWRLRLAGYVVDTSEVVLNIDEEEKEDSVSQHGEKMAVCFGLMKTRPGDELLIMKNLRMCGDCHSAFKYISKVFARVIVVRDRSRFHRFVDGSCSCRDYW
ncbi:Pentatricopeptide repeat-containing protein [Acorus gramineus]|uniref:Pentatricopeptide repeat-containing protein n=1 Tax=Acorus gramineus TaxID=55184 RepID=A0AAV9B7Y9_ACOGR|nr:Pentatricopeptide repeat-containing protein [Acorus gramineus]